VKPEWRLLSAPRPITFLLPQLQSIAVRRAFLSSSLPPAKQFLPLLSHLLQPQAEPGFLSCAQGVPMSITKFVDPSSFRVQLACSLQKPCMCQTLLDSHMRLCGDDNEELFHPPAHAACWGRVRERPAGSSGCPTGRVAQPPARCSSAGHGAVTASSRSGSKARNLFQSYRYCSGSFSFLQGGISSCST